MLLEVSKGRETLDRKVNQLESLLKEISYEIGVMEVEKKYDVCIDKLKDMLQGLNKSQNTVRKVLYSFIMEKLNK